MLLARPYLVYQMTAAQSMDPARAFSLLQRLVKKKDDHHGEQQDAAAAVLGERFAFRLKPRLQVAVIAFRHQLHRKIAAAPIRQFVSCYPAQRYKRNACLLI